MNNTERTPEVNSSPEPDVARADRAPVTPPSPEVSSAEALMRKLSRRGFMGAGAAIVSTIVGWRWLISRRRDSGTPWPLRRVLEINEQIWRDYFKPSRLAPTFARSQAREPRVNGVYGLMDSFDAMTWRLIVEGLAPGEPLSLSLEDLKALPRREMVTELKCIEGWSEIVHWAGTPLMELVNRYSAGKSQERQQEDRYPPAVPAPPPRNAEARKGLPGQREPYEESKTPPAPKPPPVAKPPAQLPPYVSIETPGGGYYVGLDLESALHPQTLLCYEMNGEPLSLSHGAPLRLVIPVKYGIKNLKQIGTIRFTGRRPADYWAERGYDWYAGL